MCQSWHQGEVDHVARNVGSLWKLRVGPGWLTLARKGGPQSYNHHELNCSNSPKELSRLFPVSSDTNSIQVTPDTLKLMMLWLEETQQLHAWSRDLWDCERANGGLTCLVSCSVLGSNRKPIQVENRYNHIACTLSIWNSFSYKMSENLNGREEGRRGGEGKGRARLCLLSCPTWTNVMN